MKYEELFIPDLFLCEQPVKESEDHSQRLWIYSRTRLSLVEVIAEDLITVVINRDLIQKKFKYTNAKGSVELFLLVMVQNNCQNLDQDPQKLLNECWLYFLKYLHWEDQNLNQSESSKLN